MLKTWKKSHSRCRGVAKVENRVPTEARIKKKSASHAAWECKNWLFQHLSNENASFAQREKWNLLISCEFGGMKKWLKWGGQQYFEFLIKFNKIHKNLENWNLVKTSGGSKICRRKSYNNKHHNFGPIVFLRRETESCQNCYESRVRMTFVGSRGSTIIFF